MAPDTQNSIDNPPYRVLARKYRPSSFDALIGQDAMVRTLGNAIATGRLAHAFLLTGVRGVGKTSTARLIAKALNCTGVDGTGGPTIAPCDVCNNCVAIAESRHMDVLEMDAASRTGVDDVREIIESVRYAPVSARYKVYIIDEVHMLSKNAFNALLKTLEEPPPHVKFLFATTEIRKVPVTVLSRCQRFDLKRISTELLTAHFVRICTLEDAKVEDEALALIARAAEGSVRDGLSMLDQAIAHGHGTVETHNVRDMLGLADRGQVLDLMSAILSGDANAALDNLREQYNRGADPQTIVSDLLEIVHAITRAHVAGTMPIAAEDERTRIGEWAAKLAMPALQRLWQMLLKGLMDVQTAPSPVEAAEMVVLRLLYAADLPDPGDLVKRLRSQNQTTGGTAAEPERQPAVPVAQSRVEQSKTFLPPPHNFIDLIELFESQQEGLIGKHLRDDIRLVSYAPPSLDFVPLKTASRDLAAKIKQRLENWTGLNWNIATSSTGGDEPLRISEENAAAERAMAIRGHPLVEAAQKLFPGSLLTIHQPQHSGQSRASLS